MIYSKSKRFIWIKTKKTAGTSIEIALSAVCSGEDVVTPISPEDELIRLDMGGMLPANCFIAKIHEAKYHSAINGRDIESIAEARPERSQLLFWNHMPGSAVRDRIGEEDWVGCFKFAVERHPYEKAVSSAYFRSKGIQAKFRRKIEEVIENKVCRNWEMYTDNNELIVDRVYRYEDMHMAIGDISRRLDIDIASRLPRAKGNFRLDRRPARDILTEAQRDKIYQICKEEFDHHAYER
jgi:hypothetical protein